ncbi:MAG: hypothetical protein JSS70_19760 [Bacteroidetes bacterium]|nr:hypothetical protein [Bacteroidota bacterium]
MGHFMLSPNLRPYGDGNSLNSPIIALGEAWGYFMGLYLAHQKYNIDPGSFKGDANVSSQQSGLGDFDGIALENFNPNLAGDPFRWIPKGLMEDLRDVNNETRPPLFVNDVVGGFTIQQIFAALQSDIRTIPAYRDRLIQQNPSNQTAQINALFGQYNY